MLFVTKPPAGVLMALRINRNTHAGKNDFLLILLCESYRCMYIILRNRFVRVGKKVLYYRFEINHTKITFFDYSQLFIYS